MDERRLTIDAKLIFAEAIERAPDERAAYVERACADRPELLDFVQRLLRAHEDAGTFMRTPTGGGGRSVDVPPAHELRDEIAGQRLGQFELVRRIGEGAFGQVFLARQVEPVRRDVAVKLLRPGLDSRYVLSRFEAERQALAILDHPNIARLLDAGTSDEGRPFFAMELVRGIRITEHADANRLSIRERVRLLIGACRGVQHAHDAGIVHRDLKPANILVEVRDDRATARVIDFGIARAVRASLDSTAQTLHGQMLGTPAYMSPEQARGGADVDTRADVYSLGCVLYELLTGTTPIDSMQLRGAALGEVHRAITEREHVPPSERLAELGDGLRSIARQRNAESSGITRLVRDELDWICGRALDREPQARYAHAGALADDLERWLDGRAVDARPAGRPMSAASRLVRRNARRLRWAGIAAGVLLVAAVWATGRIPGVPGVLEIVQRGVEEYASGRRYGLPEGAWVNGMRTNRAGGVYSLVGGGRHNTAASDYAMVGGGTMNSASGNSASVGSGRGNTANGEQSIIAGGMQNTINGDASFVGGGRNNHALARATTIAGGQSNNVHGPGTTIGGGQSNQAHDMRATIGGGSRNIIGKLDADFRGADGATIAGGIGNTAFGNLGAIGGGYQNQAIGSYAVVAGGGENVAGGDSRFDGAFAAVPGGARNKAAGLGSFAAGVAAEAIDDGSFVWADSDRSIFDRRRPTLLGETVPLVSQGRGSFTARARGGFHFFTGMGTKAMLRPGAGSWSQHLAEGSQLDRRPVDPSSVLDAVAGIEIARYAREGQDDIEHIGPTAEALATLGLGRDGHVASGDLDGVALAAIQGLLERLEGQRALVDRLEAHIVDLERKLDEMR
ncbi:MAG: protein kinase [Planctomycetota bacterium]